MGLNMADLRAFSLAGARVVIATMAILASTRTTAHAQSVARVDALLAADSINEAAQAADAVMRDVTIPASQRAAIASLFGRFSDAENNDAGRDLGPGTSANLARLAAGTVPASLETMEAGLAVRPGYSSALRAITELGFTTRGTGPALRATTTDPGMLLLVYMAARDTGAVRATIAVLDSARARLALRNLPPPVALAEAELFLGDSAAALARLISFDASWTRMERTVSWGASQNGWTLGRMWLLLGDLAGAMRRRADAERAYQHVVSLWERGDLDVQPAVIHARTYI
jgi:hypothetical protein